MSPRPKHIIQIENIVKTYKTAAGDFPALRGITAQFERGEFVGIVSKSGAGKSTLVNMIAGVDQLTSGKVIVDGTSVHDLSESKMALWRGLNVGVVYQTFELLSMPVPRVASLGIYAGEIAASLPVEPGPLARVLAGVVLVGLSALAVGVWHFERKDF